VLASVQGQLGWISATLGVSRGCRGAAASQKSAAALRMGKGRREEVVSPVTCHYQLAGEAQLKSGCKLLL